MILNSIGIGQVDSFAIKGTTGEADAVGAAKAWAFANMEHHFAAQEAVSC